MTPLTFNQTLMELVNALQVMRKQQIENAVMASPSFPHAVRQEKIGLLNLSSNLCLEVDGSFVILIAALKLWEEFF